jgi:hypothetical protein
MSLVIVMTVCFALIGVGFWHMERQKAADRARGWDGVITRLEHADGLEIPRTKGGGVNHIQRGRHIIWVHYRREDGVEGVFFVGEAGNWTGWNEEPGKPDYEVVERTWEAGSPITKPPGEAFPRLATGTGASS